MKRTAISLVLMCVYGSAAALAPLTDETLEARAQTIGQGLRCVVCQNQSIEESDATLAVDMRRLVRARVKAGDSNQEVMDFIQQRYGDFVLLKPPVQKNTYLLWAGPLLALLGGGLWFLSAARRERALTPALTDEERARLDMILKGIKR